MENGSQPLRQKSKGRDIMVSEFLTPQGRLQVPLNRTTNISDTDHMCRHHLQAGQYATTPLEFEKKIVDQL